MSRKLISLVLAVLLVTAMMVPAMAAAPTTGSITIENTSYGDTYTIYKIFDLIYADPAEYDNDGMVNTPVSYRFTGTADQADIFSGDDSPFTATATSTAGEYNIEPKSGATAESIASFLQTNLNDIAGTAVATFTGNSGSVKKEGLALGYYYITSSLGTVVTIDSTIPNVTVVDKNEDTPSWDNDPEDPTNPDALGSGKVIIEGGTKVTENTVNYGDTVNFSIAVNAKAISKGALNTYYYIKDELGDGFGPAQNIVVNVYKVTGSKTDDSGKTVGVYSSTATQLTETSDYTIVQDGNKFAIQIPFGMKFGSEAKIEVTYSATVKSTDDVVLGPDGNPNTASFIFDQDETYDPNPGTTENPNPDHPYDPDPSKDDPVYPDPEHPFDPEEPKPDDVPDGEDPKTTKTYVYGLDVLKYTGENKTPLAGAKFTLQRKIPGENPTLEYVTLAVDADVTGSTSSYDYDTNGTIGSTDTPVITLDDGKILIKGLKEGTYVLTEIEAPAGYNLLQEPVEVILNKDGSTETVGETTSKVVPKEIENKTGTELPSTGGIGTTIFYVMGSLLLVGAAVLLVTKKRMSVND